MSDFIPAFERVIGNEGGYQNNPNDSGNYNSRNELVGTKYGISAKTYESYFSRTPSEMDMRNLSLDNAREIYLRAYWNPKRIYELTSQMLANHIFDIFVNHSPGAGATMIQRALNDVGERVTVDAAWGPLTRGAVNNVTAKGMAKPLNDRIAARRSDYYESLVAGNPKLKTFLSGWLARADSFLSEKKKS